MVRVLFVLWLSTTLSFIGCTKSSGDDEQPSSVSSNSSQSGLKSICGFYRNGKMQNDNASFEVATFTSVEVISAELVIVSSTNDEGEPFQSLVKLHGVTTEGVDSFSRQIGESTLRGLTSRGAYFVAADSNCTTNLAGGGTGLLGQLFDSIGVSLTERLISEGSLIPDFDDPCGGEKLAECYATLDVKESLSSSKVNRFLWKPDSESDGKLVILLDIVGASVQISGAISETSKSNGSSNGYGSTIRVSRRGCDYGSATVRVRDNLGKIVPFGNGESSLKIDNGCSRTERSF